MLGWVGARPHRGSSEFIREMEWDEKLVNESYEWVKKLNVFPPERLSRWSSAFKNALLEAGVLPDNGYTLDHLEGTKISASTIDSNGRRHTSADLLQYANPDNIVVLVNAIAERILFDSSSEVQEESIFKGPHLVERKINLHIKGDSGNSATLEDLSHYARYYQLEHTHAAK